jgi:hypothetical protein
MNVKIDSYTSPVTGDPDQRAEFTATIAVARNVSIRVHGEHRSVAGNSTVRVVDHRNAKGMDLLELVSELINGITAREIEQTDRPGESSITG